jgi:hypothetical protein
VGISLLIAVRCIVTCHKAGWDESAINQSIWLAVEADPHIRAAHVLTVLEIQVIGRGLGHVAKMVTGSQLP